MEQLEEALLELPRMHLETLATHLHLAQEVRPQKRRILAPCAESEGWESCSSVPLPPSRRLSVVLGTNDSACVVLVIGCLSFEL